MMLKQVVIYFSAVLFVLNGSIAYAQQQKGTDSTTLERSVYEGVNPEKAASDYYLKGKKAFIYGKNPDLVGNYFLKALTNNPNHAAANYEITKYLSPDVALRYALRAYKSDTTNYWYQDCLSDLYAKLDRLDDAVKIGERMIKTRPDTDDSYRKLTTYYYYSGNLDKAMSMIDTINTRFGANPEIALLHCNMIKNLKEPTPAMVKAVQDYITLYDDIPHFVIALGDIYLRMGLNDQAILCYKRAKAIDPEELRGDVALFDFYNRRQNQVEAVKYLASLFKYEEIEVGAKIALYKEMIESNVFLYRNYFSAVDDASMSLMLTYPENPDVRKLYSEHLLRKGDIDAALAFNKTALERNIISYDALQMILEIEAYQKNYDSMMVYIDKGLELFPDRVRDLQLAKISYYSITNRYNEAIKLIQEEIKMVEGDSLTSAYYGILGDTYHMMNKNKLAYKAYDKALKYDPENVIVLNNFSYYLSLENKDLDKALKMSLIVIRKEPSNSTYIDTYAWILYKLERYNEAREIMAKAVALDTTKSSSLMLHYGDILYKLGLKGTAESYWQKALEYGEDSKVIEERMKQK